MHMNKKQNSDKSVMNTKTPAILAPAGDKNSFLAAIAANADAIYCGLKIFSARMEAENFGIEELAALTKLANSKGIQVYIAFNSMIKQSELEKVSNLLSKLTKYVKPHALIVQDPGIISLARKAGFKGELHLSTLGNCCFSKGLDSVKKAGFSRAVLPRELNIDEIKTMAEKTPKGLELEIFVHGALCYGVSGRCYWSSWFGGKSGLRGRCVQPCRRVYLQNKNKQRFFSCLDLSLDVLVKVLKDIPQITCWKIEGRKKSAHYVFYTVKAYKLLRDHGDEPDKKKTALAFLNYALGRSATHYNFLPQRPQNPLKKNIETGSGLFAGRVKTGTRPWFITREPLFTNDILRIGYEDDKGYTIQKVTRPVPKKGKLVIKQEKQKKKSIKYGKNSKKNYKKGRNSKKDYKSSRTTIQKGAPVFIIDRKEKDIALMIKELDTELAKIERPAVMPQNTEPDKKVNYDNMQPSRAIKSTSIILTRDFSCINQTTGIYQHGSIRHKDGQYPCGVKHRGGRKYINSKYTGGKYTDGRHLENISHHGRIPYSACALWISNRGMKKIPEKQIKNIWWWLPPVMWPDNDEKLYSNAVNQIVSKGGRNFVINIPWQISLFKYYLITEKQNEKNKIKNLNLWAGPFCNIANTSFLDTLKTMGFSGAIVSPELDRDSLLSLPRSSPLPLGAVIFGNWPVSISRIISDDISMDRVFSSPMGENCWVSKKDENYWVFPGWQLDLSTQKKEMEKAGYSVFITINENVPKTIIMKKRPGLWNWKLRLL